MYTVAEIAEKTGLSKQGVYNKLKLEEIKPHIHKKQGITYVDSNGLKLIEDSINNFTAVQPQTEEKSENKPFDEDLKAVENDCELNETVEDFINHLKKENERLWLELEEKNSQITKLSQLVENGQVLLREQPQKSQLLETEENTPESKGFFAKLFKKNSGE